MTAATDVSTPERFRLAFRRHAAGVAVVTVGGERPTGFTATSVASLSADPPLLSFNISRAASSWPAIQRARHVAVHLLARDQAELAAVFATSGIDRLAAAPTWTTGPHGLPILDGVAAWLVARIRERVVVDNEAVVLAEVVDAQTHHTKPLLYHDGAYAGLA